MYRLTLVKAYNTEELSDYAALVAIGRPTLIEIKGVTYCGETSAANELNMQNVPLHGEVRQFSEALCKHINAAIVPATATESGSGSGSASGSASGESGDGWLDGYELSCEHQHSCCVLLASRRLRRAQPDGSVAWMTHIDYDAFIRCVRRWEESDGAEQFGVESYWSETPHWALYNSAEAGFNPTEERIITTKPGKKSRQQLEEEWRVSQQQQPESGQSEHPQARVAASVLPAGGAIEAQG